jgi:hypothetical protein
MENSKYWFGVAFSGMKSIPNLMKKHPALLALLYACR